MKHYANLCALVLSMAFSYSIEAQVTKKVLLEEVTGTWCGLCPGGFAYMDSVSAYHENVIIAAVHTGDPMQTPATNDIANEYTGGGVPGFLIDKYKFDDYDFVTFGLTYDLFMEKVAQRASMEAEASISFLEVDFDTAQHRLNCTIQAEFFASVESQEFRFNLYVIEDNVVSADNSYAQVNFYHPVEGHPYYMAGNPMQNYEHRFVVRKTAGGAWGTENSIPGLAVQEGDTFSTTYAVDFDPTWNLDNIKLVAVVQEFDDDVNKRSTLNAEEIFLRSTQTPEFPVSLEAFESDHTSILNIYPNPSAAHFTMDFSVKQSTHLKVSIIDMSGRVVKYLRDEPFTNGAHSLTWNGYTTEGSAAAKGTYFVVIDNGKSKVTEKLILH